MMSGRLHYLDASRVILIALLIPYHACRVYNPYASWEVWSPDRSIAAAVIANAIIMVLLPGFFLVSGLASAFSLADRDPSRWMAGRLVRLGVPLIATALLLNPIQMAASVRSAQSYGVSTPSFWQLLTTPGDHWLRHLWFLPCLIFQSIILAMTWKSLHALRSAIEAFGQKHAASALSLKIIGTAVIVGMICLVVAAVPKIIGWDAKLAYGFIDFRNTFYFVPLFAIGVLLWCSPSLLEAATQFRPLVAAVVAALVIVQIFAGVGSSMPAKAVSAFCKTAGGLLGAQVLLSATRAWMNRPSVPLQTASNASFTVYLFHQPIVSVIAGLLLTVTLPPLVEVGLIVASTLVLALLAHLAVRRSTILMFLFNGAWPRSATTMTATRAPPAGCQS